MKSFELTSWQWVFDLKLKLLDSACFVRCGVVAVVGVRGKREGESRREEK